MADDDYDEDQVPDLIIPKYKIIYEDPEIDIKMMTMEGEEKPNFEENKEEPIIQKEEEKPINLIMKCK